MINPDMMGSVFNVHGVVDRVMDGKVADHDIVDAAQMQPRSLEPRTVADTENRLVRTDANFLRQYDRAGDEHGLGLISFEALGQRVGIGHGNRGSAESARGATINAGPADGSLHGEPGFAAAASGYRASNIAQGATAMRKGGALGLFICS